MLIINWLKTLRCLTTWGVNKCLFETDIDIYCIYIYIFFMYWLGFKLGVVYLLCNGG